MIGAMHVRDLSPEARAAVAEWLRGLAATYDEEAEEELDSDDADCEAADVLYAQSLALESAADKLAGIGSAPLPWSAEVRTETREALPGALRAVAEGLEVAGQHGATVTFLPGYAASVTLSSPAARPASACVACGGPVSVNNGCPCRAAEKDLT